MPWSQWSTSWKVTLVVAVVIVLAGTGFLIWYLVDKKNFEKTLNLNSSTDDDDTNKIQMVSTDLQASSGTNRQARSVIQSRDIEVHEDSTGVCGAPTETEWNTILTQLQDPGAQSVLYTDVRKCTLKSTDDDISEIRFDDKYKDTDGNTSYYKWVYGIMESGTNSFNVYFIPRGAQDLVVPLNNVHGEMHALYLALTDDLWAAGFDPSSNDPSNIQEAFTALSSPPTSSYQRLVGPAPGSDFSVGELYAFNATTPQAWSVDETLLDATKLKKLTAVTMDSVAPNLEGILRMAPRYVNYDFTLNNKTHSVRVWINDSTVPMGTKSVCTNPEVTTLTERKYSFVDITNFPAEEPTLVSTYPATSENKKILSFWNQPRSISEESDEESGEDSENDGEEQAALLFGTFYSTSVQGLPIQIWNKEAVNFSQLGTKALTIDLKVDSSVSFREAKTPGAWKAGETLDAAFLEENKAWMALLYDMPGLSFKASLAFASD